MKNRLLSFVLFALVVVPTSAAAGNDKPKTSGKRASATRTEPAKAKSITFDIPDEVDGSRLSPDGSTVLSVRARKHASLIRLRTNFVAEIIAQADQL